MGYALFSSMSRIMMGARRPSFGNHTLAIPTVPYLLYIQDVFSDHGSPSRPKTFVVQVYFCRAA